jgi:hypothetical protein
MRVMAWRSGVVLAALVLASCESPTKPPVAVASVVIGPGTALLESGATLQLAAIVRDADNNVLENRPVTWTSLNTDLATVSATGLVTAKNNRTNVGASVKIQATVGGVTDDSDIIVQPVAAATLTLTPLVAAINEGETPTLVFEARDAEGELLTGRQPFWTSRDTSLLVVVGNGQLQPKAFVDLSNRSAVVVASLGSISDSITVSVAPSSLASLQILPQDPYLRRLYSKRLRVVGTTAGGTQIPGLAATYTSSNGAVATTTAAGVVTATNTLGTSELIATYGSIADTVTLTVDNCGAGPAGGFPIELRNTGPGLTAEVQEAFDCARARIRAAITGGISLVNFPADQTTAASCFSQTISAGTNTTGVIILMRVAPIDGAGAVLGRAGPCLVRSTSRLAVVGLMEFDDADLANLAANGTLLPVILHEMLHVIGIGSTWRDPALSALYTGDTPDPGFLGENALRECRQEHGGGGTCVAQVPIENCTGIPGCGSGTIYGHWRELVFDSELMTGYIDPPRPAFSRMSIAAIGDLGYPVDLDQAEHYLLPGVSLRAAGVMRPENLRLGLQLPAPVLPTHSIDASGRVRPILY